MAELSPRFLSRPQAASYLGVSERLFDAEVARGMWPPPLRRGSRVTWDVRQLDAAADRLAGIGGVASVAVDDAAEAAALEAAGRGTKTKGRHLRGAQDAR